MLLLSCAAKTEFFLLWECHIFFLQSTSFYIKDFETFYSSLKMHLRDLDRTYKVECFVWNFFLSFLANNRNLSEMKKFSILITWIGVK